MVEALGGRKFLLTLLVITVGTLVQIYSPHGVTEAFTALLIGVTATFGAANAFVTSKTISAQANASSDDDQQPPPQQDLTPIVSAIQTLASEIEKVQAAHAEQVKAVTTLQQGAELQSKLVKAALTASGVAS